MKNLASASESEQIHFLNSFDEIFSDVDGVIWTMTEKIPFTAEAVAALQSVGKRVSYVSNNCTKPYEFYVDQLKSEGFEGDLITPVVAIISHLKAIKFDREIYVIGMSYIKSDLRNAGFKVSEEVPDRIEETVGDLLHNIKDNEDVGAVIADADLNVNYLKLQKAVTYLKRPEVLFLMGGTDAKLVIGEKTTLIGPKYFHAAVEEVSGRKPQIFAKPSPLLKEYMTKNCAINEPSRVLFIGDTIFEDMGFAAQCRFRKLLVLSGLTKEEDVKNWKHSEELKPDYYVDSLKDVLEIVNSVKVKLAVNKV